MKNIFINFLQKSILIFAFLCLYNVNAQSYALDANGVNFSFLNSNRTTAPGAALGQVGSAAIYTNIATVQSRVLYGKITVVALVNTVIDTFDNDTGGAESERFQPIYTTGGAGYVSYKIEFFDSVTNFPVYLKNFYLNGIDIDSGEQPGVSNTNLTELYRLPNDEYSIRTLSNSTQLGISQIGTGAGSDTQFRGSGFNLGGLNFENTASFYVKYNDPKTSISFKIGANGALDGRQTAVKLGTNGTFTGNTTNTNSPGPKVKNDLQVTKTVDNAAAPVGTTVEFTITIKNNGSGAATNVNVGDKLLGGYTYVSKTLPEGNNYNQSTGIWTIGNLALNATRILKVKAAIKSTGNLKNDAGVTGNETESNTDNNSASVTVTRCTAPVISAQPASTQSKCQNGAATNLIVTATGTGTLTYQWYNNGTTNSSTGGTPISGATSSTYTPSTSTFGTTYYYVIVTGTTLCGSTTSTVSRVIVNPVTTIETQPLTTQTINPGVTPATINVVAIGETLTYQWYSNGSTNSNSGGSLISGATSASFTPPSNMNAGSTYYYVIVSGDCGNVSSNVSTVVVACTEQVLGETFTSTGGAPKSFTQSPTNNGFVFDFTKLDNSFTMNVNGVDLATQEIQFQSAGTPGINIRFVDGTTYTPSGANGGTPEIYDLVGSVSTPIVRVVISATGLVSLFGSKVSGGPLFPLELFNGAVLNTVTWNALTNNTITINQTIVGPTFINAQAYGVNIISCPCRKPGIGGTPAGFTKIGISTQKTKVSAFPETVPNGFIALESTNKGFVITRTTTTKISDPKKGMIIYDTANNCVSLYNGTSWHCIQKSCNN